MSRSRARRAALAAGIVAAAFPAAAAAQEEAELPVLDLILPSTSLDGSVSTDESQKQVTVTLAADVVFDFDKATLKPAARSRVSQTADRIREEQPSRLRVVGYTDSKGSDGYNLGLSKRRAAAVAKALRARLGGHAPSLQTTGRGEANPVAANEKDDGSDNPRGRAKNRRVTVSFAR